MKKKIIFGMLFCLVWSLRIAGITILKSHLHLQVFNKFPVLIKWNDTLDEVLKLILKSPQICPTWGQSDTIWMPNLTSLLWTSQSHDNTPGMVGFAPKWVKLAPNGTNLTHFGAKPTIPVTPAEKKTPLNAFP